MCAGRFGINDMDESGVARRGVGNSAVDDNFVVAIADAPAIALIAEGKRDVEARLAGINLRAGRGKALAGKAG